MWECFVLSEVILQDDVTYRYVVVIDSVGKGSLMEVTRDFNKMYRIMHEHTTCSIILISFIYIYIYYFNFLYIYIYTCTYIYTYIVFT